LDQKRSEERAAGRRGAVIDFLVKVDGESTNSELGTTHLGTYTPAGFRVEAPASPREDTDERQASVLTIYPESTPE
jgi:hypothetical protein